MVRKKEKERKEKKEDKPVTVYHVRYDCFNERKI